MILLVGFAALAVILAAIGIYGVISYVVAQRTNEIGIRLALGASVPNVIGAIMRQGLSLAVAGVIAGVVAALMLTRFVESLIFGVKPADPLTFGLAAFLLVAVAAIACLAPALRITRLDPTQALRAE